MPEVEPFEVSVPLPPQLGDKGIAELVGLLGHLRPVVSPDQRCVTLQVLARRYEQAHAYASGRVNDCIASLNL